MGNRISRLQTKDHRPKTRVWFAWIFLSLWSSVFGLQSAQGAERIVSLNACTDELLLQFVQPDQIAGVTRFSHSPKSEAILNSYPEIQKLSGDAEEVIKIHPELVLAETFSSRLLVEKLRRMNIPVSMIGVPRDWDELIKSAAEILNLTGHSEKIESLKKEIGVLIQLGGDSKWKGKTAVFWSAAGHVSGQGTFENTILSTLGLKNSAGFEGYQFLSLEKLIRLNPDVVVVTQGPEQKDSWSHDTLFHPALKTALPHLEYVVVPESAVSCASGYTVEALKNLLSEAPRG